MNLLLTFSFLFIHLKMKPTPDVAFTLICGSIRIHSSRWCSRSSTVSAGRRARGWTTHELFSRVLNVLFASLLNYSLIHYQNPVWLFIPRTHKTSLPHLRYEAVLHFSFVYLRKKTWNNLCLYVFSSDHVWSVKLYSHLTAFVWRLHIRGTMTQTGVAVKALWFIEVTVQQWSTEDAVIKQILWLWHTLIKLNS